MAKRKGSSKRPQAEHKRNYKKSQHDKRKRLQCPNPNRKKTKKAKVPLTGAMQTAVLVLQAVLDRRMAFRFSILVAGMLLADDRRTASSWFVAAALCVNIAKTIGTGFTIVSSVLVGPQASCQQRCLA